MRNSTDPQRQLLGRAARLLASAADFRETLRQTIAACLPALGDFGFFDVVHGDQVIRTVAAHQAPDIEAILAPTQWVHQERDDGLNLCALSTGKPALHPDITDSWYRRIAANEGHLAVMRQLAFRSMLTVPVRYRDDLVGALTLFMGRSGRHHTAEDLGFAGELAALAAPVVVNSRLVDQYRQADAALRRSEERLRLAMDAGQVGIWDWDIAKDTVEWSERVYRMHEMEPGSDTGGVGGFRSRVHPDDLPAVQQRLSEAMATGAPYTAEFRTVLPGGRIRWISTRAHVVPGEDGKPVRLVGASTDITERTELLAAERSARAEAERAQRRLELLTRAGDLLSRSLDPDETLKTIGDTVVPAIADWCRIDLVDEHGVLQRRLAHHSDPALAERALERARQLRAGEETQGSIAWVVRRGEAYYGHFDAPHSRADPALNSYTSEFAMQAHFIIPLVARGRTIGALAVIQAESGRDLTADDRALVVELGRRAAMALDNARLYSAANAANRAKDEFLAMLGHELRNPLAPIATALELMARREAGAHLEERRIIGRQVAHLSRLIDDLLDVSRITRGKVQLVREPVDMKGVVAHAVELTQPLFEKHANPVQIELPQRHAVVIGDPVRLSQVLCNLLGNAAKFTPPSGHVRLVLTREDRWVQVRIEDDGAGIDRQLLPRVFELFVQGEQAIDRRAGGLGLGLAIVRTLVEMHGGSVVAESEGPGKGASFTVRLPASDHLPRPTHAPAPAAASTGGQGGVLIVDDNVDAAETLAELLRVTGYEVQCAHDAQSAMRALDAFQPQFAVLDIGLPQVDGYQLAAMVRARPGGRELKLVALTGYGRDNDRARALNSGFDEHLVKPVTIDELLKVLRSPASP